MQQTARLEQADIERIRALQNESGLSFYEAAQRLGFSVAATSRDALVRRPKGLLTLTPAETGASPELVAAFQVKSPQAEALRGIRSRLLAAWSDAPVNAGRTLAIVSPTAQEGRSSFAANLAVAFAQLGERTLIIDADLRSPRQHLLFGLDNRDGIASLADGEMPSFNQTRIHPDLLVITAGPAVTNPQEIIASHQFMGLMDHAASLFDIVIVDTPPLSDYADAEILADRAGYALFVAKRNKSKVKLMDYYFTLLNRSSVTVMGSAMIG